MNEVNPAVQFFVSQSRAGVRETPRPSLDLDVVGFAPVVIYVLECSVLLLLAEVFRKSREDRVPDVVASEGSRKKRREVPGPSRVVE